MGASDAERAPDVDERVDPLRAVLRNAGRVLKRTGPIEGDRALDARTVRSSTPEGSSKTCCGP
ncbi:MAG: hypothetical protein P8188_03085 [Gemmatimonadota bacterium]